MNTPDLAKLGQPGEPGLILYDGVCVLCSNWFRFVAARDVSRKFYFTAIQSPYGRTLAQQLGIDPESPQTNAVLLDGKINLRSDSAIAALSALPRWGWVAAFRLMPKPLRDALYTLIARNRYALFGKHDVCDLGGQRYADRIVS
ncbi:MAG TPA: DCC1-like thiol-disulfide oxidoreductase family protein [Xanthobacteraceae bacterium]|jgi:predicted DCC family thiol-disulfide oxidoreductase YuxK|nr:DCC1-like thiol-disulfide oxidoreductase family protein [Xanthobacteraceae bacterium]